MAKAPTISRVITIKNAKAGETSKGKVSWEITDTEGVFYKIVKESADKIGFVPAPGQQYNIEYTIFTSVQGNTSNWINTALLIPQGLAGTALNKTPAPAKGAPKEDVITAGSEILKLAAVLTIGIKMNHPDLTGEQILDAIGEVYAKIRSL